MLYSYFSQPFWDSAVYISNAKNLFSGGEIAYWESVRPIGWPIILGVFWKLGANLLVAGKILELLFSLGIISFVYLISKQLFNKKIANIATVIIAFNSLFIFWTFKLYTSIPATFFFILALYLFINKKYSYSGICSIAAILIRYPLLFLIFALELSLIYTFVKAKKRSLKPFIYFNLPILIGAILFMAFNFYKYENFLSPILEVINSTGWGSSPMIFANTPWLYLGSFAIFLHIMLPFLIYGIYLTFKQKKIKNKQELILYIILPMVILYAFFQTVSMKDERYILPLLPLIAIIAAFGLSKIRFSVREVLLVLYVATSIIILLMLPAGHHIFFPEASQNPAILERCPLDAKIASTTPIAAVYWNDYFPYFFNTPEATARFTEALPNIQCIFHTGCDFTGEFPEQMILEDYELIFSDESYCKNKIYARFTSS
ncbi:glycosyltransferase family 39 protein [Candidatus Woesearchaeota archaeon]|nr:glycosyltransferase family 39 protein [Candidatus Woesearchaeota archaeon]